jgi:hypothetical protein
VIDAETISPQSDQETNVVPPQDPFLHLPVLPQTLDDMLVGPAVGVLHAT